MFSRKKKFFVCSIALLCVSCLIFAGCGRNNNNTPTPPANNNQATTNEENINGNTNNSMTGTEEKARTNTATEPANNTDNTNNTNNTNNTDNTDLQQRAEKIAKAVTDEIAQVRDSRVVISQRMAYVSVDIDKTADTAESATLKDEISSIVKKTDAEIETVYVMEDANTFTRMKEIGEDIANGHPVSGFVEELENMFVRVTPSPK